MQDIESSKYCIVIFKLSRSEIALVWELRGEDDFLMTPMPWMNQSVTQRQTALNPPSAHFYQAA